MSRLPLLFILLFIADRSYGWYHGRTDLYDGDAEIGCQTSAGLDIGQSLPINFEFDYLKLPKAVWFRIRGQIRRVQYDSPDSLVRPDDFQRQGYCYFLADAGTATEYIQSVNFPRAFSSGAPYNYFFSASMTGYEGDIKIQLEWYDKNNELINSTSIQSDVPDDKVNPSHLYLPGEVNIGKVVDHAVTLLVRINIQPAAWRPTTTRHAIDMISVYFFPDNIHGSGRPRK